MTLKNDFVGKNLSLITEVIEYSVFTDEYAERDGFLQKLDPRIKLLSFLVLLVIVSLEKRLEFVGAFYLFILIIAILSRIFALFFIKRVWIFIPIFTGIIALPVIFNVVTPGRALLTVMTFSKSHKFGPFIIPQIITITDQSVHGAMMLVLRVATSISIAILLIIITKWVSLLKALSVLKLPEIIILILMMTYRYIHLFLETVESMFLAKKKWVNFRLEFSNSRCECHVPAISLLLVTLTC